MKLITLNKCLSGLDTIIDHDYNDDDYIDFDEECNTFLKKYLVSEGNDEDDE